MLLPESWVDRIFLRLAAMYGSRWLDLWRGTDLAEVKSLWRESLGGFIGQDGAQAIAGALQDCQEAKHPPTLPEFRALVRARYAPSKALEPLRIARPAVTTQQVEQAKQDFAKLANAMRVVDREWPNRLLERHDNGEMFSAAVLKMARDAKAVLRV